MTDQAPSPPRNLRGAVSEVAVAVVGSLKSQPLVIGLLLVNIAFLGVISMAVREVRQQDHAEMRLLLERCLPARG